MAMRYIGFGDSYFAKQKYSEAYDRYKKAAQAGPSVADASFRQAFVLSAMGKYGDAVKAVKEGLKINPDWPTSDFRLSELYGVDENVKQANLNAMIRDAGHDPTDSNVALLLGIHYYFDDRREDAKPLLQRAAKLSGNDSPAAAFLAK